MGEMLCTLSTAMRLIGLLDYEREWLPINKSETPPPRSFRFPYPMTMSILLGLDKHFLAVGNRRRHEPLLSGGVQHLSAHTPMGVHRLTGADILIPTVLEPTFKGLD